MIYKRSKNGGVAQLGERTVRIRKVESSILFVSTITQKAEHRKVLCFFVFPKHKKNPLGVRRGGFVLELTRSGQ